ncbi:MAG: Na/Pi cotransporter family protein [Clostridia bacterium]|nr:Na/Pi cotransporter family protein [Clostridia bacterium]
MHAISMILSLLCGVALFLFGMSLMGDGLKSVAGNKLETFLYRMTNTPVKGILLGTGVTSVIQSSSATTVMVIGFVNSGLMKLGQAIAITLGANIGTSITGWILCLSYIEGSAGIAKLLSSSTISAIAAITGILCRMLSKRSVYKNLGNILLGFAVLMVGMQTMSAAVSPLKESSVFTRTVTMFSNPFLGILLGIVMTAILQSASASIGIVQALSVTGALTFAAAFPVILGIGVGAACPVMLSAIGANKNGKRTAFAYLFENVSGMVLWAVGFYALNAAFSFPFMNMTVSPVLIALINSAVRIVTAMFLFPFTKALEKLLMLVVKDSAEDLEDIADNADFDLLEERLLNLPALALGQAERVVNGMSRKVRKNVGRALNLIQEFSRDKYEKVQRKEDLIDKYESKTGEYLIQLGRQPMDSRQTRKVTLLLRVVGDLERIGDYASNIARVTNEISDGNITFSGDAKKDLNVVIEAERDLVNSTVKAYQENDLQTAMRVKPWSAALSYLCEILKARHIGRLSRGECNLIQGTAYTELLNSFERIGSHCVAVSGAVRRESQASPDIHVHSLKANELSEQRYQQIYDEFLAKYDVLNSEERPLSVEDEAVQ